MVVASHPPFFEYELVAVGAFAAAAPGIGDVSVTLRKLSCEVSDVLEIL